MLSDQFSNKSGSKHFKTLPKVTRKIRVRNPAGSIQISPSKNSIKFRKLALEIDRFAFETVAKHLFDEFVVFTEI